MSKRKSAKTRRPTQSEQAANNFVRQLTRDWTRGMAMLIEEADRRDEENRKRFDSSHHPNDGPDGFYE